MAHAPARTICQDEVAPTCIGSEQPQPQTEVSEVSSWPQALPLTGPRQEHPDEQPQWWHPGSAGSFAAARYSAPWRLRTSTSKNANRRARKKKSFILRTQQLIALCRGERKEIFARLTTSPGPLVNPARCGPRAEPVFDFCGRYSVTMVASSIMAA